MRLFSNVVAHFILLIGWRGVYWAREPDKSGNYKMPKFEQKIK
jgi:hypothetical protein